MVQDFEGTGFGSWTTTGTAFGQGPATGAVDWQGAVEGFDGCLCATIDQVDAVNAGYTVG